MLTPHLGCTCCMQLTLKGWAALIFTYINTPTSDVYMFSISSDNGAVLWIDGVAVVNATSRTLSASIS